MTPIKVVFFGTPEFAVPSLKALHDDPRVQVQCVVSMPDRPSGRGHRLKSPEVISFAKEHSIPILQTENVNKSEEFFELAKEADIFVVLAFAQFLSQKVLDLPRIGCFNIHTSLLPKYRGAAPIQYAILNGDKETGVSIQRMVKKMDAGDICYSHKVSIEENETSGELFNKLKDEAALGLNKFLDLVVQDELQFQEQDESQVSYAPTIKKEEGFLNFKEESFEKIKNKMRAFSPWPGTYCLQGKKRIKVYQVETDPSALKPGETLIKDKKILVGCKDTTLRLYELQLEGKKRCFDYELVNGLRSDFVINGE